MQFGSGVIGALQLTKLVFIILCIAHWLACLFAIFFFDIEQ